MGLISTLGFLLSHHIDHRVAKPFCFDSLTSGVAQSQTAICPNNLLDLGVSALTPLPRGDGEVHSLNPLLKNRFEALKAMAEKSRISIRLTSGFRTRAKQEALYLAEVKLKGSETLAAHWVLPPQLSQHTRGLAIDIASIEGSVGMAWVQEHSNEVGLCRIYANERWHFEAVIAPGAACPQLTPDPRSAR